MAIRHAIRKPLIQLIKKGEQIPFDVAGTRTIQVDIHDLDSVEEAKQEIANQIRSIESGKTEIDTPISVALDLKFLRESENPEQRSLADVVEAISELRSGILSIEKRLSNPESLIPPKYLEYAFRRISRHFVYPELLSEMLAIVEQLIFMTHIEKLDPKELEVLRARLSLLRDRINKSLNEIYL